jgi:hypothetical protein
MFDENTYKTVPIVIFGAQGIALGAYRALKQVCPEKDIPCFVVSKRGMNAESLDGVPVVELEDYLKFICDASNEGDGCSRQYGSKFGDGKLKRNTEILIATPENVMPEIEELLDDAGLYNHTRLSSGKWAKLMCAANKKTREFLPLEAFPIGEKCADIEMFMAKFYKDKPLTGDYKIPDWITPIQVGAALTDVRVAEIIDSNGDNISSKNVNYSELTALYWVWKNKLETQNGRCSVRHSETDETVKTMDAAAEQSEEKCGYYGLVHYRRILEISEDDLHRLSENDVDAVLPYPMPYLPDIHAHHERYLTSTDWDALLTALNELQPEYAAKVPEIFGQQYLYNYNIMLAKKDVLRDYCRWLFPVLQRTEELSSPKGWERADRYIGYMGENLTTLYFMVNKDKLKIAHKGCRFLV